MTAAIPQPTRTRQAGYGMAAVIDGPSSTQVVPSSFPAPGPGQVRVRLEGCGVCASNLPVWEGRPWFTYPQAPGAPGHEGWGWIDAIGKGVVGLSPGDRVAVLSYHAFATHDLADAANVVALPASLADEPFPGEALGCAMNVLERAAIQPGESVAVVGIGFLGAMLVQLAKSQGARVAALSRRESSLETAHRMGADVGYRVDEGEAPAGLAEWVGGEGFGCVVEATGHQTSLDLASSLVATRGRLVIAGYHQDGPRTVDLQSWNWRGIDVINAHERDPRRYVEGMARAIEAVEAGRLRYRELLTHEFPLQALDQALQTARHRPAGFTKAWVTC